jgi:F0F1-type ATP synthase assembly protein I
VTGGVRAERRGGMVGAVVAVLLLLWTLDRLSGHTLGGLAYLLPAAAIVLVIARLLMRPRTSERS